MRKHILPVLAALSVLIGLPALGLPGLAAPAGPPSGAPGAALPPARRESLPPPVNGPAPRTGPAAAFEPLTIPSFGANVRANTDPQTPNRAQQEPSIAVNPTNPLNVVAAAKDERGGVNTKQVWIYTSTDGGTSWINQEFPLRAPLPPYSSDPVVSFSDDGWCFVTALPYGGGTAGIQVATSTDGGITFSTGTQVTPNGSADKEWTWIDNFPSSPYYHRIYVAWMDFAGGSAVRLNYSTDRGATWSAQSTVAPTAYQFPQPVVLPNGDVLVTYSPNGGQVGYRRSTDGGVTFGSLNAISSLTQPPCPPDDSGCFIWRLSGLPSAAVDSNTGDTVVTWADGRTGTAIVYYSRSTDNGATWSAAAQMAPPGAGSIYQVEPWVTTDETGSSTRSGTTTRTTRTRASSISTTASPPTRGRPGARRYASARRRATCASASPAATPEPPGITSTSRPRRATSTPSGPTRARAAARTSTPCAARSRRGRRRQP